MVGNHIPGRVGGSSAAALAVALTVLLGLCGSAGGSDGVTSRRAGIARPARSALDSAYGRLPLAFEQNRGQAAPGVSFLARGQGYTIGLSGTGPVLSLAGARGGGGLATLSSRFVDAAAHPRLVPSGPLPGRVNYLIGSNPRRWHTGLPTFAQVRYAGVWPGIEATFTGRQGQLEFSYLVAPGADPGRIVVQLAGARSLRVDRAGALIVGLGGGSVRELAPHAYQLVDGRVRTVASRYLLHRRMVAIAVGRYDSRVPLLIDPTLAYSTYLGGSGIDVAAKIAIDSTGNAYVTGATASSNFPTTAGAFQTTNGGGKQDAFVSKLNATGTALLYSTYIGGSGTDYGAGLALDATGNAYVLGHTASSNFPTTAGAFQTTLTGTADAFVTKLNSTGTALLYSTYLGGSNGSNSGNGGVAIDSAGDAYVAGTTTSSHFPTTAGAFQTTFSGNDHDAFVTKLNPTGTALVYSTYLAGSTPSNAGTQASGIAVDSGGDAYVDGYTKMTDFPTTAGAFQTTLNGTTNGFVTKLNPTGTALAYSSYLGGSGKDVAFRIAIDGTGDAYLTGAATSTNFPTTAGAFQTTLKGAGNAFVTKVNPTGTALVYSTYLGGSGSSSADCTTSSVTACEGGLDITVDATGDAYATGATDSSDFPTTAGAYQTTYGGAGDAFVTKLNPAGTGLVFSTYLGGSALDAGAGIAVDSGGAIYVAGGTESTNFPTTAGAFQTTLHGTANAFVSKLVAGPSLTVSAPPSGTTGTAIADAAISAELSGGAAPSGSITFTVFGPQSSAPSSCTSGGTAVGTGVSVSGNATYHPNASPPFTPATAGDYWWYAHYGGDTNNVPAASACGPGMAETVVTSSSLASPALSLTAPSAGTAGSVIAASSVSGVLSGGSSPTGTISFRVFGPQSTAPSSCTSGGMAVGTAVSISGDGTYHPSTGFTPSSAGDYWWYADYGGDVGNNPTASTCGPSMAETVVAGSPAPPPVGGGGGGGASVQSTAVSLSSSANPSITGQQVTLTATVTPNPGGGTVDFSDPGPTIPGCGAVAVNSSTGIATCKVTYNSTGSYPVQASYSGFAFYTGSQSPVLTQVVTTQVVTAPGQPKPTGTTTRLGASADPVVVGQRITYTAKVSSAPDGGSVRFLADGKTIARCGAVPVSAATGTSRCRATHAKPGSYGIQAVYSGDSRFTSSQSPVVIETVRSSVTLRGSPTGRSGVVSFTVHCAARSGGCRVTGTLTTAVTLHGHTVTALSASTNHKHHHTVTVGARTVSVSAGKTVTIRAKLNATGRALLAAHNELPVTLTISLTVEGQHSTVAIVKLTVSRLGGRGP